MATPNQKLAVRSIIPPPARLLLWATVSRDAGGPWEQRASALLCWEDMLEATKPNVGEA